MIASVAVAAVLDAPGGLSAPGAHAATGRADGDALQALGRDGRPTRLSRIPVGAGAS